MKKQILLPLLAIAFGLFTYSTAFGQKAEVDKRLQEYDIPQGFFEDNLKDENATHSFTIKSTNISGQNTFVEVGTFNPTFADGKRWTLVSVNGNEPTDSQKKQFNKEHNESEASGTNQPEDDDWKILEDSETYLIVGFQYNKKNLPHKYKYLAQCKGKAFVNKKDKRLEKVEFYSTETIKISVFHADKFDMVFSYTLDEESNTYLIEKEETLMDARLLGQLVKVEITTEFFDYKKVR